MADKIHPKDQFKALGRSIPFKDEKAIDRECLECFAYEYAGTPNGDIDIVTTTEEFTSVCPFSGLPDFASVKIRYTPDGHCLELRSLKYYLMSYRDVGIWYEHLVNRILNDLVNVVQPKSMSVEITCNARGGLVSAVKAEYVHP
ncbi:MAG: preQ(1) synthase [Candidatus Hydrogenedentota bacterium]